MGGLVDNTVCDDHRYIKRPSAHGRELVNFTKWLATEMAQKVSPNIRCNAIAPGFFIAEQNRTLLTNEDGSLTARGQTIMKASPMGRFGDPSELGGPLVWLCSDAASFVTGTTIAVDGGFSGWCAV